MMQNISHSFCRRSAASMVLFFTVIVASAQTGDTLVAVADSSLETSVSSTPEAPAQTSIASPRERSLPLPPSRVLSTGIHFGALLYAEQVVLDSDYDGYVIDGQPKSTERGFIPGIDVHIRNNFGQSRVGFLQYGVRGYFGPYNDYNGSTQGVVSNDTIHFYAATIDNKPNNFMRADVTGGALCRVGNMFFGGDAGCEMNCWLRGISDPDDADGADEFYFWMVLPLTLRAGVAVSPRNRIELAATYPLMLWGRMDIWFDDNALSASTVSLGTRQWPALRLEGALSHTVSDNLTLRLFLAGEYYSFDESNSGTISYEGSLGSMSFVEPASRSARMLLGLHAQFGSHR